MENTNIRNRYWILEKIIKQGLFIAIGIFIGIILGGII
jgi:hypothetical protein